MIGDDAHTDVVVVVAAIDTPRYLRREIENRPNLIDLVHVFNTLFEERNSFHPHTGVDILLGELAINREFCL